jgi:hypothetical protein
VTLPRLLFTLLVLSAWTSVAQVAPHSSPAKPLRMGRTDSNTFVGLISDSSCGAKHKMTDKTATECARACVRDGAGYVLLAGDKSYPVVGHERELRVLAGQKAKITGSLEDGTIRVDQVSAAR